MIPLTVLLFALSIATAIKGAIGWPNESAITCAVIVSPFFLLLAIAPLVFALTARRDGRSGGGVMPKRGAPKLAVGAA